MIGEELIFKNKLIWKLVDIEKCFPSGVEFYKYKVFRKYYHTLKLSFSKKTYRCYPWKWEIFKNKLKKDKDFWPNMTFWSGEDRPKKGGEK